MSRWQHSCCDDCWKRLFAVRDRFDVISSEPHRLVNATREKCCFCGAEHESGIRVRENWAFMPCRGETGIHAPTSQEAKA